MKQQAVPQQRNTKDSFILVAILLGFVLVLVFIWLWYDIQITSLEKKQQHVTPVETAN